MLDLASVWVTSVVVTLVTVLFVDAICSIVVILCKIVKTMQGTVNVT